MTEKTKQTDSVSASLMCRRSFIIRTGAGVGGLTLFALYPGKLTVADPLSAAVGWGSFLRGVFHFAKKVGMIALGITLSHYLNRLAPEMRDEIAGSLAGISNSGYRPKENAPGQVAAGESAFLTPLLSQTNLQNGQRRKAALVPFYDISRNPESRIASVLSTPTMSAMPSVAEDLEQLGFGMDERYGLLVPTRGKLNSYNMEDLPDTYLTRGGSVEADYRGNESSGDLTVRVTRKRDNKSERLEPVLQRTYGVDFDAGGQA